MPPVTLPNEIELRDFSAGFQPDLAPAAVPVEGFLAISNFLPDAGTGVPVVRKGYAQASSATVTSGHEIKTMTPYSYINVAGTRKHLIMLVSGTGGGGANNISIWKYDIVADTLTRVDTAGRTWASGVPDHWGAVIQGKFYGGGILDPMYSYNDETGTWNADAGAHDFKTMIDPAAGITLATQVSSDKAFRKGDKIQWSDADNPVVNSYKAIERNRWLRWKIDKDYGRHARVSIRRDWFSNGKLWYRSFRAKKDHTASAVNRPGDGTGAWQNFWRPLELDYPRDEETVMGDDWRLIPEAATTDTATWHGYRLWLRYDDLTGAVGKVRTQYSAPAKPETDDSGSITTVRWDPKDFSTKDDEKGQGGGWLADIPEAHPIEAYHSYANMLLIYTRRNCYVLSGLDEDSWTGPRLVGRGGAMGMRAVAEHEGLVYAVGPHGLTMTDGTDTVEPPGTEKVQDFIRETLDNDGTKGWVNLWSHDGFVWISLPSSAGSDPGQAIVYDPLTKSCWKQSFGVWDTAKTGREGQEFVYFSKPGDRRIFQYNAPAVQEGGANEWTDDGSAIVWSFQTAWLQWGAMREERRIRKTWVLLRADNSSTLKARRNFTTTDAYSTSLSSAATEAAFREGKVTADAYSISFLLNGTGYAEFHGFGVKTEPRRQRYHV